MTAPKFPAWAARLATSSGAARLRCRTRADDFIARSGAVQGSVSRSEFSGWYPQEALTKAEHPLPVIFLSGHGDIPISVEAIRRGAEDFLTKPVKKELLLPALARALARDEVERADRALLQEWRRRYDTLTPREREVMALVVTGLLIKQIAGELGTVERTVKAHRAQVMEKMQIESITELVRAAQLLGDYTPET